MQVLFEIMVQNKQKGGKGVESPPPRSISGGHLRRISVDRRSSTKYRDSFVINSIDDTCGKLQEESNLFIFRPEDLARVCSDVGSIGSGLVWLAAKNLCPRPLLGGCLCSGFSGEIFHGEIGTRPRMEKSHSGRPRTSRFLTFM